MQANINRRTVGHLQPDMSSIGGAYGDNMAFPAPFKLRVPISENMHGMARMTDVLPRLGQHQIVSFSRTACGREGGREEIFCAVSVDMSVGGVPVIPRYLSMRTDRRGIDAMMAPS